MTKQETKDPNSAERMTPHAVSSSTTGTVMFYIFCVLTIGLLLIWYVVRGNTVKTMEQTIQESDSDVDVQLTKRANMLGKMKDATSQSMKWEKSTIEEVTKLRSLDFSKMSTEEKAKAIKEMKSIQDKWNFQMEAYPNLRSTEVIQQLNTAIESNEEQIAAARRIFNSNVSVYNRAIITWPTNIIAQNRNLWTKSYLQASDEEKQDVKMDLGA